MSRVFESLRQAEEEAKAKEKSLQEGGEQGDGRAGFLARLDAKNEEAGQATNHLLEAEPRTLYSPVEQLTALAARLEASRGDLEALVATAQRVREGWESEVRDSQQRIQESNLEALRAAAAKVKAEVLERAVSLSRCAVDQAMRRLEEKASGTLEDFAQNAVSRLAAHTSECVAQSTREIAAFRATETERSAADTRRLVQDATAEFDGKLKAMAGDIAAQFQQEVKRSLEQFTGELLSRRDLAWREKVEATERSLQEELENSKAGIQEEVAKARGTLQTAFDEQVESAGKAIATRLEAAINELNVAADRTVSKMQSASQKSEADMKTAVEGYARETVAELSNSACLGVQNKLGEMIGRFRNELSEMLRGFEDKAAQRLQGVADRLVESSGGLIRKQCEEALDGFKAGLTASGKELAGQTEKQLGSAKGAVDALARRVGESIEGYRGEFKRAVEELRESAARDLGANFQAVLEEQREAVRQHLLEETRTLAQEVMAQIKLKCEEVSKEASEAVHKQVGQAAVVLKDWADQAGERLDGNYQKTLDGFETHMVDISRAALERHRQSLGTLVDDVHGRIEQAARVLKGRAEAPASAEPHPHVEPHSKRPPVKEAGTEDVRKQLHDAVDDFLKRVLENTRHNRT